MMVLTTTAVYVGPTLMAVLVDKAIPEGNVPLVLILSGVFTLIYLFNSAVVKQRIRIMNEVAQNIILHAAPRRVCASAAVAVYLL
jgi:ABC-type bacteriocin/lantibiotic exporter with double-glycine peptidase domain